jgi:hypothetical protein
MADDAEIDRAVLRPMRALYSPPRHLRADEDALDAALATYRRALGRFDPDVLARAWQQVVEQNELWCWPKLSDLVKAADQAQRELHPQACGQAWVEQATRRTEEYTRRFLKTSAHAARASQGGYEPELKRYVREAAWVQAQLIAGQRDVGYDHAVLFGQGPRDRDAEEAFFAAARAGRKRSDPGARAARPHRAVEGSEPGARPWALGMSFVV